MSKANAKLGLCLTVVASCSVALPACSGFIENEAHTDGGSSSAGSSSGGRGGAAGSISGGGAGNENGGEAGSATGGGGGNGTGGSSPAPGVWRPFSDDSPWNTPIGAN